MVINLKDVQKNTKENTEITTIKISKEDKTFITDNKINLRILVEKVIADLRKQVKG